VTLSETDAPERSELWWRLSEFYLNEQMTPENLSYIAARCADSKYSSAELDVIMFREVYPAFIQNVWAPLGQELPWPKEVVVARVGKFRHPPTYVRWWTLQFFFARRDWTSLKRQVVELRKRRSAAPSDKSREGTLER
jgi:hypothetical protein